MDGCTGGPDKDIDIMYSSCAVLTLEMLCVDVSIRLSAFIVPIVIICKSSKNHLITIWLLYKK